ncbi:MAG: hypothetical protein EOS12_08735 [Mesorhizobium sp.]|nr:MAG: hypothetical protein EOS12_08735 [Mesorhizobium sp.]
MSEKRGRKRNEADTTAFRVSVPKKLHDYLQLLARNSFIGANVGEVAAYMITQQSLLMMREKFHELDVPAGGSAPQP